MIYNVVDIRCRSRVAENWNLFGYTQTLKYIFDYVCFFFTSTKNPLFFLLDPFVSVWQPSQNPGDGLAGRTINKHYILTVAHLFVHSVYTQNCTSRCSVIMYANTIPLY